MQKLKCMEPNNRRFSVFANNEFEPKFEEISQLVPNWHHLS